MKTVLEASDPAAGLPQIAAQTRVFVLELVEALQQLAAVAHAARQLAVAGQRRGVRKRRRLAARLGDIVGERGGKGLAPAVVFDGCGARLHLFGLVRFFVMGYKRLLRALNGPQSYDDDEPAGGGSRRRDGRERRSNGRIGARAALSKEY